MIVGISFMGFDFIADVDYRVTSYGSPAHMGSLSYPGDPGDPPEWEIERITLQRDVTGPFCPEFVATGALFDCLAELDAVKDAIMQDIAEYDGPDERDDDYGDCDR
jgi:hypothetical protein